jgi:cold-inducible RNA-binding protein
MRIFVGNLDWALTEDELERLFEPYGIVNRTQIATRRDSGRSRGFGFVDMPNATEAQAAIEALNGTSLGGRTLTVNEARPREGGQSTQAPTVVRGVRYGSWPQNLAHYPPHPGGASDTPDLAAGDEHPRWAGQTRSYLNCSLVTMCYRKR